MLACMQRRGKEPLDTVGGAEIQEESSYHFLSSPQLEMPEIIDSPLDF